MPGPLPIFPDLEIPAADLDWSFSRSGGPGGQHVNTTDTRARVHFALGRCAVLGPAVKQRLRDAHPGWVNADGDVVVSSDEHRSQLRNTEEVERRLAEAIRAAMRPPRVRRATKPTRASKAKRLDEKKARGAVKSGRRSPGSDD